MIPPAQYVSEEHHKLEIDHLFSQIWFFAGMRFELEGLSHLCVQIADKSVVLQADKFGHPRAFLNVCSHRHARLCDAGRHTGAIRCPYHGWVYDREGLPVGIPSKASFPKVVADPQSYQLHEFSCAAVGEFIFVRLASDGPSLSDYLGNQYAFLEQASVGMAGVTDEFTQELNANWKVVIENALEGYHVPAVHSQTFMQVEGMDSAQNAAHFFFDAGPHSHLEHTANPEWLLRFSRMEKKNWPMAMAF